MLTGLAVPLTVTMGGALGTVIAGDEATPGTTAVVLRVVGAALDFGAVVLEIVVAAADVVRDGAVVVGREAAETGVVLMLDETVGEGLVLVLTVVEIVGIVELGGVELGEVLVGVLVGGRGVVVVRGVVLMGVLSGALLDGVVLEEVVVGEVALGGVVLEVVDGVIVLLGWVMAAAVGPELVEAVVVGGGAAVGADGGVITIPRPVAWLLAETADKLEVVDDGGADVASVSDTVVLPDVGTAVDAVVGTEEVG